MTNVTSCLFSCGDNFFRRGKLSRALIASSIPEIILDGGCVGCVGCAVAIGTLTTRAARVTAPVRCLRYEIRYLIAVPCVRMQRPRRFGNGRRPAKASMVQA